jgi:hypothetical protein
MLDKLVAISVSLLVILLPLVVIDVANEAELATNVTSSEEETALISASVANVVLREELKDS